MAKTPVNFRILLRLAFTRAQDENGRTDLSIVKASLLKEVTANPALMDAEGWVNGMVDREDRSRRPKIKDPSFFDGDALIPTGENIRVRMEDARRNDLAAWQDIVLDQYNAQYEAYLQTQRWINARNTAFADNSDCKTVGDLERKRPPDLRAA